jgi:hypothetical protein
MSKSAADIVAEMIAAMKVADPELDTSIGSVVRKIFDVMGEQIAPAYADGYLSSFVYDVDTKSGSALDDFVAAFAFSRLPATRAIGVTTFARPTKATENITIPANTQVSTGSNPQVIFATVAPAVLIKGTTNVSVPIQAVVAGQSGNLPADALTNLVTPISGINPTVQQGDATTGGTDAESDTALRARFKRTVFRSMAGTEDMFIGVAIEDTTPEDSQDAVAVQANVIGASKFWVEQVQVIDDGGTPTAISTIPASNTKHVYVGSATFGDDINSGSIMTEGVHYTFDTTFTPPHVIGIGTSLIVGNVYDLMFEYVPMASRNEPSDNITNRVDIWVAGVAPQQAVETTYYQPVAFTGTPGDPFYASDFKRLSDDGLVSPTVGNKFLQLAWGPIIDFPETLTVGGVTYARDTDYWVVHDDTGYGYTPSSKFGLEWLASHQPTTNAKIVLSESESYFYNRLPADVEARAKKWKLITDDVKAHAAKQIRLALNFAIMYSPSYDRGVVQAGVDRAVAQWMDDLGFKSVVQVSDILAVAHGVAGVDNIRFLNSLESATDDADDWGIQYVTADGTFLSHFSDGGTPDRVSDIVMGDNEVPVLYDIRYLVKAQNTFGEPS